MELNKFPKFSTMKNSNLKTQVFNSVLLCTHQKENKKEIVIAILKVRYKQAVIRHIFSSKTK